MFDDQNTNQGVGGPPADLPVADIFADTDKVLPQVPKSLSPLQVNQAPPGVSVPATPPTALSAGALKPVIPIPDVPASEPVNATTAPPTRPSAEVSNNLPPVAQSHSSAGYTIKDPGMAKGIIMIAIVIIGLVIVIGGGWWVYASFIRSDSADSFPTPTEIETLPPAIPPVVQPEKPDVSNVEVLSPAEVENTLDSNVLFGDPVDTDGDGLDDSHEKNLGTDPENWDSDGDLLSDFDEVSVWNTDPFNPDTDGDGFLDGSEVKNGYSPNGLGSIFEPPVGFDNTLSGGADSAGGTN